MSPQQAFEIILNNNSRINRYAVRKVLLLYEEKIFLIGDACINFNELRHFRGFFPNAEIGINFLNKQNAARYEALLLHNPYLDDLTTLEWEQIGFEQYDVVFCITYNEEQLLQFLAGKYVRLIEDGAFSLAVFSVSQVILQPQPGVSYLFPLSEELAGYVMTNPVEAAPELYIQEDEQKWGNRWLESNGLQTHERLFVILDSTTRREKLLDIDVYFELLLGLLQAGNSKLLIFDEKIIGKEDFYREWLGEENAKKIIFSKGLSLREDLCLIGSRYTQMVFGPCTGLMHCAAAIYNFYLNKGVPHGQLPLLITYTGQYPEGQQNAAFWWGKMPWVNCLWLKQKDASVELQLLGDMTRDEMDQAKPLPCSEYTSAMLCNFVTQKLDRIISYI